MEGEEERDGDEEEQSEERGGRRGLLVIELCFLLLIQLKPSLCQAS